MNRTPGPWTTSDLTLDEIIVYGPDWYPICELCHVRDAANARLIAAAPQLLEALKQLELRVSMFRKLDHGEADNMPVPKFLADARAAIKGAGG